MDTIAKKPNQTLRAILIVGAIATLGIWAWAWTPVIEAWNNPADGGFSAIPGVMATFTILPLGVFALFNALRGRTGDLKDARIALIVVAIALALAFGIEIYGNILEAQDAART
jgi:hypothetical protein